MIPPRGQAAFCEEANWDWLRLGPGPRARAESEAKAEAEAEAETWARSETGLRSELGLKQEGNLSIQRTQIEGRTAASRSPFRPSQGPARAIEALGSQPEAAVGIRGHCAACKWLQNTAEIV